MNKSLDIVANRQINLTYIIAGCLAHAFDDMQDYLRRSASELNHENKHCILEMIKLCSRYNYLYERLRRISVTNLDDQLMFYHNDAIDKYYSLLITLVTRIGTDDKSDLRGYALMNEISKFPERLTFPNKEKLVDKLAWQGTINHVESEGISDEYLNSLLTIDTHETEQG